MRHASLHADDGHYQASLHQRVIDGLKCLSVDTALFRMAQSGAGCPRRLNRSRHLYDGAVAQACAAKGLVLDNHDAASTQEPNVRIPEQVGVRWAKPA